MMHKNQLIFTCLKGVSREAAKKADATATIEEDKKIEGLADTKNQSNQKAAEVSSAEGSVQGVVQRSDTTQLENSGLEVWTIVDSKKNRQRERGAEEDIDVEGKRRDRKENKGNELESNACSSNTEMHVAETNDTPLAECTNDKRTKDKGTLRSKENKKEKREVGKEYRQRRRQRVTILLKKTSNSKIKRHNVIRIYKCMGKEEKYVRGFKIVGFNTAELTFGNMDAANRILERSEEEAAQFEAYLPERKKKEKVIKKVMTYKNVAYATAGDIVLNELGIKGLGEYEGRGPESRDFPALRIKKKEFWEKKEIPIEEELEGRRKSMQDMEHRDKERQRWNKVERREERSGKRKKRGRKKTKKARRVEEGSLWSPLL
uniref:uncharacterized protein LOC117609682 n=1 Tax=Osmia lignaria TaxID=473952 RepID=UPI001479814D|nr:uncharacterized protein LOC117609682 [Osmia lignaria]